MTDYPGASHTDIQETPQIKDRLTFLYLEKCAVSRKDSAVVCTDRKGRFSIPSAQIATLILGPGTTITHRAIELAGESGVSIIWVGENGVRFYAAGSSISSSSRLVMHQADLVSHPQKHLDIVRKMYTMRFPGEDLAGLTLQQMRGKEGQKMKRLYQEESLKTGVTWLGRRYDEKNKFCQDTVNCALSTANSCLYGLTHAVICALGLSPELGFIHIGSSKSLVYDIADLYKAEITIPLAFRIASKNFIHVEKETRKQMRDIIFKKNLLQRMVRDLLFLFDDGEQKTYPDISLWTNSDFEAVAGKLYSA